MYIKCLCNKELFVKNKFQKYKYINLILKIHNVNVVREGINIENIKLAMNDEPFCPKKKMIFK